ncbi:Heterokaryon incompatibility [Fusarium oxysporum f. sp. vasinfectum]|nr:Heterokaryon incompatibility [Fusarium oxysporum f. sp. vasinfectum]
MGIQLYLRLSIGQGNPEILFGDPERSQMFLQFYTDYAQGETWKRVKPLPDICDDHLSREGLSFVNTCFYNCVKDHKLCKQDKSTLPTRILDIGSAGDDKICLAESEALKPEKYVALSYCWGRNPSIKALTGNLEDMKTGIGLGELPAAYTDAIALTRELGVRYLWIDALCIIQDSEADWERECSRMADTYANAFLTIAASSSTSVTSHFLRPQLKPPPRAARDQSAIYSESMRSEYGPPILLKVRLMQATGAHWKWRPSHSTDQQPLVEPLTQRGWTLQEKVLSTRLLSISVMEMAWTCKEAIFCECGSKLNHQREFGGTPLSQISRHGEAFNFWHKVIENYSKRNLTQAGDKLPAISAIAAIVQKKIGSDYVAGLWTDNIDLDLLWRRPSASRIQAANSSYIAPSFSWASITGEVDYLCFRNGKWPYEKAATVLEVNAVTGPDAPLGRVISSKMIINGPMVMGYLESRGPYDWYAVRLGRALLWFSADTSLSTIVNGSEVSVCRRSREHNRSDVAEELKRLNRKRNSGDTHHLTEPTTGNSAIRCWVLRLGAFPFGDKGQRDHEWLVLGRSATQPELFERIGLGSLKDSQEAEIFGLETITTVAIV